MIERWGLIFHRSLEFRSSAIVNFSGGWVLSATEGGSIDLVDCVFCDIVKGSTASHVIYQDDEYVAILDKYPIAFGHTLVMPKKHFERVNDLSLREFGALYARVYALNRIITSRMNASASHISINDGVAANQLIPHVHVHIIPAA